MISHTGASRGRNDGIVASRSGGRANRIWWFTAPVTAGLVAMLILAVLRPPGQLLAAIVAYVNCVVGAAAIFYLARKQSVEAFIPVLSLPLFLVAWSVTSLYFTIFDPTAFFAFGGHQADYLTGNLRVQLCVAIFLMCYLPIVFLALRMPGYKSSSYIKSPGKVANVVAVSALGIISFYALCILVHAPHAISYVSNGLFNYFSGLFMVCGALFTYMSKKAKLFLAGGLSASVFFFTLGNARGMALMPCLLLVFGIFFLSKVQPKIKVMSLLIVLCCFPVYLVVGNTTRLLLHNVGFGELGARFEALENWRTVAEGTSFAETTFGRLSHAGGLEVITTTPEEHPYLEFNPLSYMKELVLSLLPQKFFRSGTYYSGTLILRDYGFNIVPGFSDVEVSELGNFWLLGGYPAIFLGSIALGLLQAFLITVIRKAGKTGRVKQIFLLAVLSPRLVWATSMDFITQFRYFLWILLVGLIAYRLLARSTGEPRFARRAVTRLKNGCWPLANVDRRLQETEACGSKN
ncbi:MAG: hypothetical protein ACP5SH_18935 [Syntrophobacteraceae bacterium]